MTLSTDTNNPFDQVRLIEKEEAVVDGVLNAIANTQSALIRRESGITAGRIFQRVVLDSVSNEEQMIHIECNSVDQEPFVVINRIFELLGWRSEASASGGDNLLADGVDSILTGLPGVEFVMGLIDNTGDSDMTREVMIEDAAAQLWCDTSIRKLHSFCVLKTHIGWILRVKGVVDGDTAGRRIDAFVGVG